MKSLKKYIAIGLVGLLVFTSVSYLIFNQVLQFQKEEFRVTSLRLADRNTKQIRIPSSSLYQNDGNLQWAEDNRELIIQNVYYEVISVTLTGDTCIINAIEDEEENRSYTDFFALLKSNQKLAHFLLLISQFQFRLPNSLSISVPKSTVLSHEPDATKAVLPGHPSSSLKPPLHPAFS